MINARKWIDRLQLWLRIGLLLVVLALVIPQLRNVARGNLLPGERRVVRVTVGDSYAGGSYGLPHQNKFWRAYRGFVHWTFELVANQERWLMRHVRPAMSHRPK